jgi:hypothetical protein
VPAWGIRDHRTAGHRYPDHEETIVAGEAHYLPPGHVPEYADDTEVFKVSPAEELNRVVEVGMRNVDPADWSSPLPGTQSS